jgi:hypothetical protein
LAPSRCPGRSGLHWSPRALTRSRQTQGGILIPGGPAGRSRGGRGSSTGGACAARHDDRRAARRRGGGSIITSLRGRAKGSGTHLRLSSTRWVMGAGQTWFTGAGPLRDTEQSGIVPGPGSDGCSRREFKTTLGSFNTTDINFQIITFPHNQSSSHRTLKHNLLYLACGAESVLELMLCGITKTINGVPGACTCAGWPISTLRGAGEGAHKPCWSGKNGAGKIPTLIGASKLHNGSLITARTAERMVGAADRPGGCCPSISAFRRGCWGIGMVHQHFTALPWRAQTVAEEHSRCQPDGKCGPGLLRANFQRVEQPHEHRVDSGSRSNPGGSSRRGDLTAGTQAAARKSSRRLAGDDATICCWTSRRALLAPSERQEAAPLSHRAGGRRSSVRADQSSASRGHWRLRIASRFCAVVG